MIVYSVFFFSFMFIGLGISTYLDMSAFSYFFFYTGFCGMGCGVGLVAKFFVSRG